MSTGVKKCVLTLTYGQHSLINQTVQCNKSFFEVVNKTNIIEVLYVHFLSFVIIF